MKFLFTRDLQFFLFRKKLFLIFFLFLGIINACKKEITPATPGSITGPKNVCPGDSGITYTIVPVDGSTFYLWTVPDDAKIISGQGTVSIVIKFGSQSGTICVKSNNNTQVSNASCMTVTQGGVSNSWCREMNFKGGLRTEAVGFSIGNKGYFGTGIDDAALVYNDFWEYDPALNIWTQKANFGGVARDNAVGFSIGSKGYIGTGNPSITFTYLKDFWEYDPLLNQWKQKADCGDSVRSLAFGFSIGNKGYIGSGNNAVISINRTDFLEYDPATNQWVKKADVVKRAGGVGFSIGNKGYLGTGYDGSANHNDFWEYDPADTTIGFDVNHNPLGKWTQKASFPGAIRYAATGFSIGNKGYIGTGFNNNLNQFYKDFFEYDPTSDTWIQKPDLSGESRGFAVGFSIGKNGYIGTGNIDNVMPLSNFWVYGQ